MVLKENAKEKAIARLYELLELRRKIEKQFGVDGYNIFVFGSYVTTGYMEGKSDIDIAIYTKDFDLYKRISVYCAPLKSSVQFTDYYPAELVKFRERCQHKLDEIRAKIAV